MRARARRILSCDQVSASMDRGEGRCKHCLHPAMERLANLIERVQLLKAMDDHGQQTDAKRLSG